MIEVESALLLSFEDFFTLIDELLVSEILGVLAANLSFFSLELDLDRCLFLSFVRDSTSSRDDKRRDSVFLLSLDRDLLLDLDSD